MSKCLLTSAVIMGLTFSINAFSSDRSLKGSSLENHQSSQGKLPQKQEAAEIDDMRTLVGGSMGGADSGTGHRQQREEEKNSEKTLLTCKEAMEKCQSH